MMTIIIVGLFCFRVRRSIMGWVDPRLDRPQARSCHRRRCLKNLPNRRYLDCFPLVPLPDRLGTFRGWQCHLTRLRGCVLWYLGHHG